MPLPLPLAQPLRCGDVAVVLHSFHLMAPNVWCPQQLTIARGNRIGGAEIGAKSIAIVGVFEPGRCDLGDLTLIQPVINFLLTVRTMSRTLPLVFFKA